MSSNLSDLGTPYYFRFFVFLQWNHHCRDCLYNIEIRAVWRADIECTKIRTPWAEAPSLPIPIPPTPKKTTVSYQNPTLQTPSSPKHPGTDVREDPHHQMTREITVEHAHKTLLPPRDEAEHDTPITHRLIGAYRYDTYMHLCPYAPHRRRHGVGRGQPVTDPSPGTIPHICSPSPSLVVSYPGSMFFFFFCFYEWWWFGKGIKPIRLNELPIKVINIKSKSFILSPFSLQIIYSLSCSSVVTHEGLTTIVGCIT